MTQKIFVDRSRYEAYGRCPRARYENYHRGGIGIESVRKPLPLAVGGSVHVGNAHLVGGGQGLIDSPSLPADAWMRLEDDAVAAALADFAQYARVLELPDAEAAALTTTQPSTLTTQLMDSMKMEMGRAEAVEIARSEMDEYLFQEQSALVEALVRAYARRRLRPLLEQFEVLEVEREGEWLLSEADDTEVVPNMFKCTRTASADEAAVRISGPACGWQGTKEECPHFKCPKCGRSVCAVTQSIGELWFMSRPDALLRERESNELYLLSYKTAASWDIRKARDAEHDMQGMSEGVEVERRLASWWNALQNAKAGIEEVPARYRPTTDAMRRFLAALDAPPRIHAVRYEYILKGGRWKDKELSERFGVEMRSQKSHLIRQYVAVSTPQRGQAGYSIGDVCWSWDYIREDGRDGSLAWQNWKSRRVENVKEWIDQLDDAAPTMSGEDSTMGLEPRLLGYKCDAQAVGVTREHPLDAVFIPPITIYRNEDELRDLVDQMEAVERRIAEGVSAVESATDEGERRHQLNVHFPQNRRACEYPTTCAYSKVCYGGDEIRRDPLASGLYKIRTPNHPVEVQS